MEAAAEMRFIKMCKRCYRMDSTWPFRLKNFSFTTCPNINKGRKWPLELFSETAFVWMVSFARKWILFCNHLKNWTTFTVRKFYFQNIPRVFLEYFHTTENIFIPWNWTKLWKWFSNLFLQYFLNISMILWIGPTFPVNNTNSTTECAQRQLSFEWSVGLLCRLKKCPSVKQT